MGIEGGDIRAVASDRVGDARLVDLRSWCQGIPPLPGRLIGWQRDLLGRRDDLANLLERHGSPLNLINPSPLARHAAELVNAANSRDVELRVFFARKANKALALVDAALEAGHGIAVASDAELSQVLERGATADRVIVSAAVKQKLLVERAIAAGVSISVDNLDELDLVREVAGAARKTANVGLIIRSDQPVPSRFGLPVDDWTKVLADGGSVSGLDVRGIHVHVHGYDAEDRVTAMANALELASSATDLGHPVQWIDMGGGVPVNYVDEPEDASPSVYPATQSPVRGEWLASLLDAWSPWGMTVSEELRSGGLRLHMEPGRALLDGCGLTVARVESRTQGSDGTWLIRLAMNHTQCRSAADFLVDPILLPTGDRSRATEPIEGHLVGANCIESELLTGRRLSFPRGVAVGDLVVFVNTAAYRMHILESAAHQIPLAKNLIPDGQDGWQLDPIDA